MQRIYSDVGVVPIEVPFFSGNIEAGTPWDWNYTTIPQTGLDGRVISYPRGHVLGGSSSISE